MQIFFLASSGEKMLCIFKTFRRIFKIKLAKALDFGMPSQVQNKTAILNPLEILMPGYSIK